jgi:hypothetical protein
VYDKCRVVACVAAILCELGKGCAVTAILLTDNNVWSARAATEGSNTLLLDVYDAATRVSFHTVELLDCGVNSSVTQLVQRSVNLRFSPTKNSTPHSLYIYTFSNNNIWAFLSNGGVRVIDPQSTSVVAQLHVPSPVVSAAAPAAQRLWTSHASVFRLFALAHVKLAMTL